MSGPTSITLAQQIVTFFKRKQIAKRDSTGSHMDAYIRSVFAQTPSIANPKESRRLADLVLTRARAPPPKPKRPLTGDELEELERRLIATCLTHVQDSYRVHLNRVEGTKLLQKLLEAADADHVGEEMVIHVIWACISCMHHFLLRLTTNRSITTYIRRSQAMKILTIYERILSLLIATNYETIINAIITFFDEANLWDLEIFCSHLLLRVLLNTVKSESMLMNEMLDLVENSTLTSASAACQIVRVLHDVQDAICWTLLRPEMITRIIDMYYKSVTPDQNHDYDYKPLEKGLETCIRSMSFHLDKTELLLMIKQMLEKAVTEELAEESLLNFGSLTEHIASKYNDKIEDSPFPEDLFPLVLKLMASKNLIYSLLGNRIMHNLADRMKNKKHLATPSIFFRNAQYKIIPNTYNSSDKKFFQKHRELLQKTFVQAVFNHGSYKVYLETVYISMALWILEVPCGYTAAAGVCIAIAIQDGALENKKLELTHSHCLHATVISLLSLICYVHNADVFYDYVNKIVEKRAAMAPHLNPPLRTVYKYAQHHILWNNSEFFFEDWETRYGLWKCFKTKKTDENVVKLY